MQEKTAILFFTLTPDMESGVKKLHYNDRSNAKVVRKLYSRTKALLQKQTLPVVEVNENDQHGEHFADRLTNAISRVFNQGFEQLIVVGNDCPLLSLQDLRTAKIALQEGRHVMGETLDGGAYLIGIPRTSFCAQSFALLPWTTSCLGASLRAHLLHRGPLVRLKSKTDANDVRGLQKLIRRCFYLPVFRNLLQIVLEVCAPFFYKPNIKTSNHTLIFSYRGPPLSV